MSASIRKLIPALGPAWLTKDQVQGEETDSRMLYPGALVSDALLERARLGTRARFPGGGAPEDALAYIGRDRSIIRGPSESREAYEARLQRAIDDHRVRGNPWALMEQVRGYCSPHAIRCRTVDEHGNWRTIDRDGTRSTYRASAWDWDGSTLSAAWARFWLLIYPTTGTPKQPWDREGTWGDGATWGDDGETLGSTATPDDVQAIRSIVRTWKRAGSRCLWILVVFDDTAFDPADTAPPLPDGTWGDWSMNSGGVQVPTRSTDAIYWKGTGP